MKKVFRRIFGVLLAAALLLCSVPKAFCYEAGEPWRVDLTNFIDNPDRRQYVEIMLDHYLRTDETVQKTLQEGYCAMFFFEGCSDNMDDPSLSDLTFFRVTAVCIALKINGDGELAITYFSPNCSTLPDRPLEYGAWSFTDVGEVGPATVCDGTYETYSVKHLGQYEALHIRDSYEDGELSAVYMVPEGYVTKDANMINIHTRTSNHTSGRGMWSAGCLLVGDGNYGQFLDMMSGTYYAVHDLFEVDKRVGSVTIDRYRLKEAMYELYEDEDAVDMLLANSRHNQPEAYLDGCTRQSYSEKLLMQAKQGMQLMTLPCDNAADVRSFAAGELQEKASVEIVARLWNQDEQLWYETQLNGKTCYIPAEGLREIPDENWFSRIFRSLFDK